MAGAGLERALSVVPETAVAKYVYVTPFAGWGSVKVNSVIGVVFSCSYFPVDSFLR